MILKITLPFQSLRLTKAAFILLKYSKTSYIVKYHNFKEQFSILIHFKMQSLNIDT